MSSCGGLFREEDEDDDFQPSVSRSQPSKRPNLCLPHRVFTTQNRSRVLNVSSGNDRDGFKGTPRSKRSKLHYSVSLGKENFAPFVNRESSKPNLSSGIEGSYVSLGGVESCGMGTNEQEISSSDLDCGENRFELAGECCSLDTIKSSIDCSYVESGRDAAKGLDSIRDESRLGADKGYLRNSIEGRLMSRTRDWDGDEEDDFEVGEELDILAKLCEEDGECEEGNSYSRGEEETGEDGDDGVIVCPVCGVDISDLEDGLRLLHTNDCLDKNEDQLGEILLPDDGYEYPQQPKETDASPASSHQAPDISPVVGWLRSLGLERYEEIFLREEIDWETLKWLTEEDLSNIGITALGPRKKLINALAELQDRPGRASGEESSDGRGDPMSSSKKDKKCSASKARANESKNVNSKLITDFFLSSTLNKNKVPCDSISGTTKEKHQNSSRKCDKTKIQAKRGKSKEVPPWCCVPGTPFRVDAFRYLRRDCSHWFLTHFHLDHYQGLTKSFCHGKLYCSTITAKLVNMKLGITWDNIEVLPLNQKVTISNVQVTCLDANHCPGSLMILFEPSNGKAVLHTGDFRFTEEIASLSIWQECRIHTLILDTTYCNPQYDFPKQDEVTQFVIDAIQAESFNTSTLFLIGSYTVGKERLYLEVARAVRRKVYVGAAKFHIIQCFGYSEEDLQWFTVNEHESHIHVVPMWTLASFKRLKHIANQYSRLFSLVVAFSPTGWTFGKGKKSSGRRWQQGTIIRYEVPYSEHSSFSELREFVKLSSPTNIIPSVNNEGADSINSMISYLST
ncbi:hypothetical protein MLD38_006190 [Melastoma candidum]|uniref:Uncharacterized protein n=1 Tax=Melastoma candidum TaxID=119954 RepID=A0ACB9RQU6_9MYRT|nr:hypothetical protein MLD38_006190 [Melastoma candidum]